jgi:hypothetical protein
MRTVKCRLRTFAERHHLREGDSVVLHPPGRIAALRIAGVYYDYTTEGGLVVMDHMLFQELWHDPWLNSIVIYLAPGTDAEVVRRDIGQISGREDLVSSPTGTCGGGSSRSSTRRSPSHTPCKSSP